MLNFLLSFVVSTAFAQDCPAAPYGASIIKSYDTEQICHINYMSQYNKELHDPIVVNWVLTKDELQNACIKRSSFRQDPLANGSDISPREYIRSGYDKGHMSPAEDNAWNQTTEDQSFYMTNMTPQVPELNRDGWKYFEQIERQYALQYGKVIIWSGPIFVSFSNIRNEIRIPDYFWKVIFIPSMNKTVSILVPNKQVRGQDILTYLSTPNEIEQKANIVIPLPVNVDKNIMGDTDDITKSNTDVQNSKSCSVN